MKMLVLAILGTVLVAAFILVRTDDRPQQTSRPPVKSAPTISQADIDKAHAEDLALQPQREAFIQKMIAAKMFTKVDMPGTLPHLWIGPAFHLAAFEEKQKAVAVVYAYYLAQNERFNSVVLKDEMSGREIGVYSSVYGGLKMY